jgi:hypothetical protein
LATWLGVIFGLGSWLGILAWDLGLGSWLGLVVSMKIIFIDMEDRH